MLSRTGHWVIRAALLICVIPALPAETTELVRLGQDQECVQVAAADLDGSGHPDLILLDRKGRLLRARQEATNAFGVPEIMEGPRARAFAISKPATKPSIVFAEASGGITWLRPGDRRGSEGSAKVLALGDFDGDHLVDVALADSGPFTIIFGDDHRNRFVSEPGDVLDSLASGDLNGDGYDDLVASTREGDLLIFESNGNGVFNTPTRYRDAAGSVALTDWNEDGKFDIVFASASGVWFRRGEGNGTFSEPQLLYTGPVEAIAPFVPSDPNDHGLLLVTPSDPRSSKSSSVILLVKSEPFRKTASPSDSPSQNAASPSQNAARKDWPRKSTASSNSAVSISLSVPASPALINQPVTMTASVSPASASGSVFFYDGVNPLGVAAISGGKAVRSTIMSVAGRHVLSAVVVGSGLTSSSAPLMVAALPASGIGAAPSSSPATIAQAITADFNGDGQSDLAVANMTGNSTAILLGNGNGTFTDGGQITGLAGPSALTVADWNLDGNLDIAVVNSAASSVIVSFGAGDGTFLSQTTLATGFNPVGVIAADLNRDGIPDLATLNADSGSVSIWLNNGDGSFRAAQTAFAGTLPAAFVAADFNGDGKVDLAVTNLSGNKVAILLGNGDGTFNFPATYTVGTAPISIVSADLNGDGRADLVVGSAGTLFQQNAGLHVLRGNGDGSFQAPDVYSLPGSAASMLSADIDGDGNIDIVVSTPAGTLVFPGTGTGALNSPVTYLGFGSNALVTGDFNGDGTSDVAFGGPNATHTFAVLAKQAVCTYDLSPPSPILDAASRTLSITLSTNSPGCSWTSASDSWLAAPASGTGSSVLNVSVAANSTGVARTGSLSAGGSTISILQKATIQAFTDVTPDSYWFDAINLMKSEGITSGCGPNLYCPAQQITRDQMAVFLVRAAMGGDNFTYSAEPYFDDVSPNTFGFAWIQKLNELGITSGCGNHKFCPLDQVLRDQMAVFIVRTRLGASASFTYPSTPYFTDVPQNYWAFGGVQRMKLENITSGCGATQYCPSSPVTRGDMAIFMMRGAFNQLLPAGTPIASQISPKSLSAGDSGTFTVSGVNTHFQDGVTQLAPMPGISVSSVLVNSSTSLTATLSAAPDATKSPRSIVIQTGTEEAVLPNGLSIQ
jgi:hypothetical protein